MKKVDMKRSKNPKRILQKKISKRKYSQSEKGREADRRWRKTAKGRANSAFHNKRRRERLAGVIRAYTKEEWLRKVENTRGFCPKCNSKFIDSPRHKHSLTLDHNPPISKVKRGFIYTINETEPLCFSCNSSKQDKG